jgi:hypothetical protein
MFTIILLALIAVAVLWLSTLQMYNPEQGQLAVLTLFGKHVKIIAVGIPEQEVTIENSDGTPQIVLGIGYTRDPQSTVRNYVLPLVTESSWMLLIWPYGIDKFPYSYKRHKTLDEVNTTKGEPRWKPERARDAEGKELPLSKDTIVLGYWKEEEKKSLFFREREEIRLPFRTGKDGIEGNFSAYLQFFIWNVSAAISAVKDFKADHEKAAIDLFRHWAGNKDREYLKDVQNISFDKIEGKKGTNTDAKTFFRDINRDNYHIGVFLEDIKLEDPYVSLSGRDILEAKELQTKNEYFQKATEVSNATAVMIAQKDAKVIEMKGEAEAKVIEVKGIADNKVAQENRLNEVTAEVSKEKQVTEIKLDAAGKIIDKAIEYKKEKDVTEVQKWEGVGKTQGTVVIVEGKKNEENSQVDDLLVANAIGNIIGKKQGGNNA